MLPTHVPKPRILSLEPAYFLAKLKVLMLALKPLHDNSAAGWCNASTKAACHPDAVPGRRVQGEQTQEHKE